MISTHARSPISAGVSEPLMKPGADLVGAQLGPSSLVTGAAKKSSSGPSRSARTGRYVTEKHGKANPNTTVKEARKKKKLRDDRFPSIPMLRRLTNLVA